MTTPAKALPAQTIASAMIGGALIQWRVSHSQEHKIRLLALAEMALALGAISRADLSRSLKTFKGDAA